MHKTIAFTDWHEIKMHKIKYRARLVMAGEESYIVIKDKTIKVYRVGSHSPIDVDAKNQISVAHARKLGIL